jgi:hypothetical protein
MIEVVKLSAEAYAVEDEDTPEPIYETSYYAVAYAQQEALMRFPDSQLVSKWWWGLAYSYTRLNNPETVEIYANLIEEALDAGQVRVNELSEWFSLYEPSMILYTYQLPTQPGELGQYLIEIVGEGGAYIWLIEKPGDVETYSLASYFDYENDTHTDFTIGDFTNDGNVDVAIYRSPTPGAYVLSPPIVFDLSFTPPIELTFEPDIPIDFIMNFEVDIVAVNNNLGGDDIQYTAAFFPACPVYITRTYRWDNQRFEHFPLQYDIEPRPELLGFCEVIVDHSALVWGPEVTLSITEPLLHLWPPLTDPNGDLYPLDEHDEWRYRLGVYNALVGHQIEAERYFNEIINEPIVPFSSWIEPSEAFLEEYHAPEDVYRACQGSEFCNIRDALEFLTEISPTDDPSLALDYLQDNSVITRSSGNFDFELDGEEERWFTVRHRPNTRLEFWILANYQDKVKALFVEYTDTSSPELYFSEPIVDPPTVQMERGRGFILERQPESSEPYIVHVLVTFNRPTIIMDALDASIKDLFSGADPYIVLDALLEIESSPRFAGDCIAFNICDRFYYTLGLVYELIGYERDAVDTYIALWWEYSKSLFTIMAREKLEFLPPPPTRTPTPTITPTHTNTPTQTNTPDPNASPTPSPTITPTVDPNATPTDTPTVTPTATITFTPDPNATSTPTQTPTPTNTPSLTPTTGDN